MANHEPEQASIQAPFPLAMVICDGIWVDPATGKQTLLGCFTAIRTATCPVTYPMIGIFTVVTDGRGTMPLTLRVVDSSEDEKVIFEAKTEVTFSDPRAVVEGLFHIGNAVFPTAGEYRFQLYAGSAFLIERRLLVIQDPPK